MEYEIGTTIDLSYLNRKVEPATKSQPLADAAYEVGTQILFKLQNNQFTAAKRINVVFA